MLILQIETTLEKELYNYNDVIGNNIIKTIKNYHIPEDFSTKELKNLIKLKMEIKNDEMIKEFKIIMIEDLNLIKKEDVIKDQLEITELEKKIENLKKNGEDPLKEELELNELRAVIETCQEDELKIYDFCE